MAEMAVLDSIAALDPIVALDPGENIGVAWVDVATGKLLARKIVSHDEIVTLELCPAQTLLIGDGTGMKQLREVLQHLQLEPIIVDETGTTLQARALYFADHPPKGWQRLLPKSFWFPPDRIDDYAAYAIALRYLQDLG